jgi:hypothetical protein
VQVERQPGTVAGQPRTAVSGDEQGVDETGHRLVGAARFEDLAQPRAPGPQRRHVRRGRDGIVHVVFVQQ